MKSLIKYF